MKNQVWENLLKIKVNYIKMLRVLKLIWRTKLKENFDKNKTK